MPVSVVTHLNFTGNAREALQFYQSVFGGRLSMGTYGQGGVPHDSTDSDRATFDPVPENSPDAEHISFGMLVADNGVRLAAYDVFGADGPALASYKLADASSRAAGLTHTEPFFVALSGDTRSDIEPLWNGLADGGTIIQALAPSSFSPAYGMITDRYGVTWIVSAFS